MKIHTLAIRRYRGIQSSQMESCGGLNVLIGRNNAGKSTFLSAISRMFHLLKDGELADQLKSLRLSDEFTNRDFTRPFQIGIELTLTEETNRGLRERLQKEAPHLENSIRQISNHATISFIIAGTYVANGPSVIHIESIATGGIDTSGEVLAPLGIELIKTPTATALEILKISQSAANFRVDLEQTNAFLEHPERYQTILEARRGASLDFLIPSKASLSLRGKISDALKASENATAFAHEMKSLRDALETSIKNTLDASLESPLAAFSGPTKRVPDSIQWLIKTYAQTKLLNLSERRRQIGREEANQLLNLKVSRGGTERLVLVQKTVQSLLGVRIDAFQSTDREGKAEMDVDEFLAEANGAGVREALRIVLDLELSPPDIVLLEEPEVHLHPGLEKALDSYLRKKSETVQFFTTTHSTNFIDSFSMSNVFLISRDSETRGLCTSISAAKFELIPQELGLKLSTVFMFDRLAFVEGPTDEAVLRIVADKAGIDLARAGIGFVQMGGVSNFAAYAAESTLSLLSRRQLRMWFMIDRDERSDRELEIMRSRLGERAKFFPLNKRELENYFLSPEVVREFIGLKQRAASAPHQELPTTDQVETEILGAVESLREAAAMARVKASALKSIHLQQKNSDGTPEEKIERAIGELQSRQKNYKNIVSTEIAEMNKLGAMEVRERVSGSEVIDIVCRKFGVRFNKANGDSVHLARSIFSVESLPHELVAFLKDLTT